MAWFVHKYGGSSVADAASVRRVAQRIVDTVKNGDDVAVVVSAMGDTTDELIELAEQVSPNPPARELDMLLTAGERISMAVLAMAIADLGLQSAFVPARGFITTAAHGKIIDVTPGPDHQTISEVRSRLLRVSQGFPGHKDVTTLGRGRFGQQPLRSPPPP